MLSHSPRSRFLTVSLPRLLMLMLAGLPVCVSCSRSATKTSPPPTQPSKGSPSDSQTTRLPTKAGAAEAGAAEAGPKANSQLRDPQHAAQDAQDAAQPAAVGAVGSDLTKTAPPLLTLEEKELAEGWISLFDGKTLFGWQAHSDANWHVENGCIVVSQGDKGLLCTTTPFADYVLKLDFRSASGTNSGVFLRTPAQPQDPSGDCYELNIADADNEFPTCSLVKRQKAEGNFDSQDWQSYEVTVQGPLVIVKLDGVQTLEYRDPNPLQRGLIGLQLNQGKVEFRNIKLKPLGLASIFNGKDLEGWNQYPEMPSVFSVTEEGTLNVKNGRGQLETKQQYANFVFQLECISHAPGLNSGIFFRCLPGQQMNGYESQIHNGYLDGDRSKPVDCGTGGIFRRQPARYVVADDGKWFHKTIIADEAHVAAWINGYQVSDWTDERPPHENPRQGLRREAGTIMIQGHDPTTNLSFRNLRIAELPEG